MSVLKNQDIDLSDVQKTTLRKLLFLYVVFTIIIVTLTSSLYITLEKELKVQEKIIFLNEYTTDLIEKLETLDTRNDIFPKDEKVRVSLYDTNYTLVYSTFDKPAATLDKVIYSSNNIIRYIKNTNKSYLDTQYIVTKIIDDKTWYENTIKTIVLYAGLFFIFMIIIGYFLLNLFLQPMKNSIRLLDTFIKDTTHELNTPISTITTNIELIKSKEIKDEFLNKSINRIDISAKTITNIYDDLTYLILNHKIMSKNEDVKLNDILEQRIEYFASLMNMKKLKTTKKLDKDLIIHIDKVKLSKVIDNILSNAIKYNKNKGSIHISLKENILSIKDTGIGIKEENINKLLNRYTRFENSVGGFGIGLNIVKMICEEYNLDISIDSQFKEYTQVNINFSHISQ